MKFFLLLTFLVWPKVYCCAAENDPQKIKVREALTKFHSHPSEEALSEFFTAQQACKFDSIEEFFAYKFSVMGELDRHLDDRYDVDHPPVMYATVPLPLGYNSGISPDRIKDPKVRADYIGRIAENKKVVNYHHLQVALRKEIHHFAAYIVFIDDEDYRKAKIDELVEKLPAKSSKIYKQSRAEFEERKRKDDIEHGYKPRPSRSKEDGSESAKPKNP